MQIAVITAIKPVTPATGLKNETINNNRASSLLLENNNNEYVLRTVFRKVIAFFGRTIFYRLNAQVPVRAAEDNPMFQLYV